MLLRRILPLLGTLLLATHFLLLAVHAWPEGTGSRSALEYHADRYAEPVFFPAWQLFAPEPPVVEATLFYRVHSAHQGWSSRIEPGRKYEEIHRTFRLSPASQLYRIDRAVTHELWQAHRTLQERGIEGKQWGQLIRSSPAYQNALWYARGHVLRQRSGHSIDSLALFLEVTHFPRMSDTGGKKRDSLLAFPVSVPPQNPAL